MYKGKVWIRDLEGMTTKQALSILKGAEVVIKKEGKFSQEDVLQKATELVEAHLEGEARNKKAREEAEDKLRALALEVGRQVKVGPSGEIIFPLKRQLGIYGIEVYFDGRLNLQVDGGFRSRDKYIDWDEAEDYIRRDVQIEMDVKIKEKVRAEVIVELFGGDQDLYMWTLSEGTCEERARIEELKISKEVEIRNKLKKETK